MPRAMCGPLFSDTRSALSVACGASRRLRSETLPYGDQPDTSCSRRAYPAGDAPPDALGSVRGAPEDRRRRDRKLRPEDETQQAKQGTRIGLLPKRDVLADFKKIARGKS
jgi:hypothetical protein